MAEIELILARQLASYLALPILIIDAEGSTFFYNEPAERLLGLPFDEVGPMTLAERGAAMAIRDESGEPVPLDHLPPARALRQAQPDSRRLTMRGFDGVERQVEVTAFPLTRTGGVVVGSVAVVWEHGEPGT